MKNINISPVDDSLLKADLHLHSRFSDGQYDPSKLIRLAAAADLDVISVTDHDTVSGLKEASAEAGEYGCLFIPGVELEAFFETNKGSYSLHILGYNVNYSNPELKKTLKKIIRAREVRARQILNKLSGLNIDLPMEIVLKFSRGDSIGRVHIGQALKKLGFVENIEEAFSRYIGDDKPAYVPKNVHSPEEIIDLIHNSGGMAVWAHPCYTGNDALLHPLIERGLDGLECYHTEFNLLQIRHYLKLAREHELTITGGSDYHGTLEEDFELGEWWFALPKTSSLLDNKKHLIISG